MKHIAKGIGLAAVLALGAMAQESRFTFGVGGGFTEPRGSVGSRVDRGWNVTGNAGVNFNRWVGGVVDVGFNRFGMNSTTTQTFGVPDGNVRIFSATLNPIIHLSPGRYADVYLIGGGGVYHTTQQFTAPSSAVVPVFDPFFGFYNAVVPATQVLSSSSLTKPGINGGIGFAVGTRWKAKVFAEARYHRIFRGNDRYLDYIPVSFGLRW